jgi:CxxC motif-containing protein
MTNDKEITCIVCPIGCKILVKTDGTTVNILKGYKCKQGVEYARNEALDPRRVLTTSILVDGGAWPLVSVKSSRPVPKEKLFAVLKEIRKMRVKAPVESGQVLIKNVADTDIDIVATKDIKKLV